MTSLVETAPEVRPAIITPKGGVRCWSCGAKNLNEVGLPYDFDCHKCKVKNKDGMTRSLQERIVLS